MKTIANFLMLSIFICTISSFAQEDEKPIIYKGKRSFFVESSGFSSTAISLQYDRIFSIEENHYFNYSAGFGIGHIDISDDMKRFSIPLSINYSTGLKKHHFELGTGLNYLYTDEKSGILTGLKVGYKYQSDHLYFKLSSAITDYVLVFEEKNEGLDFGDLDLIYNLLGIAVGYSF